MTLDEWLTDNSLTNTDFAKSIGATSETVRRYRKGLRYPEPGPMQSIIDATGGAVTANDWFLIPTTTTKSSTPPQGDG